MVHYAGPLYAWLSHVITLNMGLNHCGVSVARSVTEAHALDSNVLIQNHHLQSTYHESTPMALNSKYQTATSKSIPYVWRFLLLNLEPFFALNGAFLVYYNPLKYLSTMTRGSIAAVDPSTHFIYTELAGGWLHFAFTEAIVLRLVDDLRVWRLLCAGMLLSDIAYCHSCAQAVGGWSVWFNLLQWTLEDWIVTLTTWPFVIARCIIVLGIGLKGAEYEKLK